MQGKSVLVRSLVLTLVAVSGLVLDANPANAQPASTSDSKHWSVYASYTPSWNLASFLQDALSEEGSTVVMEGTELTIGFGRASTRGGEWGISYVRKPFSESSGVTESDSQCNQFGAGQPQICTSTTTTNRFDGVFANGVEAHWFFPFVRIKDRVQVGLNVGVGISELKGNIIETETGTEVDFPNGRATVVPVNRTTTEPAADKLLPYLPLFKLEAQGAVIIAPMLKVKFAGGLNFPGTGFRVGVTYLIGAK